MGDCDAKPINPTIGEDNEEGSGNSLLKIIVVACIYSVIIVLTILGNLLVILAYQSERNIRRSVGNIFIVNLAIVGLIVGSCFLTINCIWLITDDWIFGEYPCKVWLLVDYTTSYMLVVSMIYISLDRLLQIKLGMTYYKFQTPFRAITMIGVAWFVIFSYYSVVIFGWSRFTSRTIIDYSTNCEMETFCSQKYNLAMVFVEFLFPFVVLLSLNIRVFWEIRLRAKGLVVSKSFPQNGTVESTFTTTTVATSNDSFNNNNKCKLFPFFPLRKSRNSQNVNIPCDNVEEKQDCVVDTSDHVKEEIEIRPPHQANIATNNETQKSGNSEKRVQSRLTARHKREIRHCTKAGVTLACLVGVFVICWLPITLITAFFSSNKISELWWEVANNLLWCNATLNPILYALTNLHFRNAFKKLTTIRKLSHRNGL